MTGRVCYTGRLTGNVISSINSGRTDKNAGRALTRTAALSLSLFVFPSRFTKTRVIFGVAAASHPDIFNWGKCSAALNLMHFDSCAHTGTTHIKSACWGLSSWLRDYLSIVEVRTWLPLDWDKGRIITGRAGKGSVWFESLHELMRWKLSETSHLAGMKNPSINPY